jgi:hypothetical protein
MQAAVQGKLYDYGVWRAPVLVDGLPAIWAVDAHRNVRKVRKIKPTDDEETLADLMWEWLREHYPKPQLALVDELETTPALVPAPAPVSMPTRRGPREIDPRLFTDPRSPLAKRRYLDGLIRNSAQRSGVLRFRRTD